MSINLTAEIDNSEAIKKLNELQKKAKDTTSSIVTDSDKIDLAMRKIGAGLASLGIGISLTELARQVVQVRGEFQQLEVAFSTMLGSKAEADELMSRVVNLAATTPFDLQGVANGAKQLLAYGSTAEDVTKEIRMLGDVAAGLSLPLSDMVYLYGTTRTQGRLFTRDLMQFTGRGIPLMEELADQFGVAKSEVGALVTAGKVGFAEVEKALISMTSEGGKFYNLMEAQSKTITGRISNLEDSISQMFNEIGKASEGVINKALDIAGNLVENYEKVGRILMDLVVAYGAYKAAVIAVTAAQKVEAAITAQVAVEKQLLAMSNHTASASALRYVAVQKLLQAQLLKVKNVAAGLGKALTNPYVLAGVAIMGAVYGIYKLVTAKSAEEKALERVNKKLEENAEKEKELADAAIGNISAMQDSIKTALERVEAYQSLIDKYPELLDKYNQEEIKLMQNAELQKEIAQISRDRATKELQDQKKILEEYIKTHSAYTTTGHGTARNERYFESIAELEIINKKLKEQIRLQEQANFEGLKREEKIEILKREIATIDELLKSEDALRAAESGSMLRAQKAEKQKRVDALEKVGAEEKQKEQEEAAKQLIAERKKAQEEAHRAEVEAKKAQIKDKVELLEFERDEELKAIDERIKATKDKIIQGYLEQQKLYTNEKYQSQITNAINEKKTQSVLSSLSFTPINGDLQLPDPAEVIKKNTEKIAPEIAALFGDMRNKTVKDLNDIADAAEAMLTSFTDDPEKLAEIRDKIEELRDKAVELESPLKLLGQGFKELFSAKPNTEAFEQALANVKTGLQTVQDVVGGLDSVLESLGAGEAMDGVLDGIGAAISAVEAAGKGAKIGSAFGAVGAAAGAAIGAIGSLVKSISEIHDKKREKNIQRLGEQIKVLERGYEALGRAIDDAYSTDAADLIGQQNELLEQQKELIKQQMEEEEDKKNTSSEAMEEYQRQLDEIDQTIANNTKKAQGAITGISFDSFRDHFLSSLSDMSKSSEDFAEDFEKMLQKAIFNALLVEKYDDRIKALYEGFSNAMDDGEMTEAERAALQAEHDKLVEDMTKDREEMAKTYGWDSSASGQSATSKGFQAMSQDTGDELNGRFTDIQGKVGDIRALVMEIMNTGKMQSQETTNIRDIMIQLNGNVADIRTYTQALPEMRDAIYSMNRKLENL